MRPATLELYARLRLLVGYLGEKAQAGWWPTAFLAPTTLPFLMPVYPRTYRLAQYNGVREAARRLHDEFIGVGNVFHLFRLPEEVEQDLHHLAATAPDAWYTPLSAWETALADLEAMAAEEKPLLEGPHSVARIELLTLPSGAKTLAGHYLRAFAGGVRTFPYFAG